MLSMPTVKALADTSVAFFSPRLRSLLDPSPLSSRPVSALFLPRPRSLLAPFPLFSRPVPTLLTLVVHRRADDPGRGPVLRQFGAERPRAVRGAPLPVLRDHRRTDVQHRLQHRPGNPTRAVPSGRHVRRRVLAWPVHQHTGLVHHIRPEGTRPCFFKRRRGRRESFRGPVAFCVGAEIHGGGGAHEIVDRLRPKGSVERNAFSTLSVLSFFFWFK